MSRLFLLLSLVAIVPACAGEYPARVVGITDGDTITVLTADRKQAKIRLHGIDAPESGQDFGSRAKQAASELAFGKAVTIQSKDTDRYSRTVAEVILPDGRSLNHEMVKQGMAWWFRHYAPKDRELERLEREARRGKLGLWSQPGAVPPWEWRDGKGVPHSATVIGNRRSRLYHRPNCPGAIGMSGRNRVSFRTELEAEEKGYRRARDCW
jgi:endonuclease YncB( thermonuclease family)